MKNQPFRERVQHAWAGLGAAWHGERSFRTQGIMALVACVVMGVLRPGTDLVGISGNDDRAGVGGGAD